MIIQPSEVNPRDLYKLMIGLVVPRPIAWVSSVNEEGQPNLAPYSFFNAVSADPPVVCFAPSRKPTGDNRKDTLRNVEQTGEFVVNLVSADLAEAMNKTSEDVAPEVNEFALAGLEAAPSLLVKAPRVATARASLECKVKHILPMGDKPTSGILVIGEVVCFHVADGLMDNFKVDPDRLDAVGRMGGFTYSTTRDRFDIVRPGLMKG
ncbi:MAG: flavin reductase family protein [Bryobacter sp.]|nr:flavin reductase family protein [Bryobacter sp.]